MNITGGITFPKGFQACGAHVGLKRKRKDLALVFSEAPATAAAVFTTNVVKAAPVVWNQQIVACGNPVRAIVVNSGHANACTGPAGSEHAERVAFKAAAALGLSPEEVLLASTGLIGVPLPVDVVERGIDFLAPQLSSGCVSGTDAAEAIKTTDTFIKECATTVQLGGKAVRIGAMAKGSGMIHPNMATMLAFLTTDVDITADLLQEALKTSVSNSYNMISVDGDTSTNDMVAILANGLAGNELIDEHGSDFDKFCEALHFLNTHLAKSIASDGEGASKVLTVTVKRSATMDDARKLARSVVSSNLVKTAAFGEDPNWGRIVVALGYAGVQFDPQKLSIELSGDPGSVLLMKAGKPYLFDAMRASDILKSKDVRITIDMNSGAESATAWGCDLSYDYVRINGAYRAANHTEQPAAKSPMGAGRK